MNQKNETAMHSLRVAYEIWVSDQRFSELLELLKEYPCNIKSVALFTSSTHSPLTIEEITRRAEIMKERMKEIRAIGLSAGINILTTIGHHEEDLDNSLCGNFTHMTGENGEICRGCYCMNDQLFIEQYVKPVYEILALAQPDFIWVDDDVRYAHMPIGNGCFCENCIDKFNAQNSTNYTRKGLVDALNCGDILIRRAWLSHNTQAIVNLFVVIEKTVHKISEGIILGFMTGERYMEGYDFSAFAHALSCGGKYIIMWRPGGGAYADYCFDAIVEKAEQIGRQTAYLPEYVTVVQSEIENFPYQLVKKTPVSTALEAAWSMTSGCTGAAFNILPSETNEPVSTIIPHLKAIDNLSCFYRLLSKKTGGKSLSGICIAWSPDGQLAAPRGEFNGFWGGAYTNAAKELFDLGLPQCYTPEDAAVMLVRGAGVTHWSDEKISSLLCGGVYMDVKALDLFNSRGFSSLTGFETLGFIPVDARECYVKHRLNKEILGGIRNCRQAFNFGDSYELKPTQINAEITAKLIDYHDKTLASCCSGIYENKYGGRISVGGYYPFEGVSDYYKAIQFKDLMLYLSKETLPSYVDSYCRIRNHTFVDGCGITVALMNPTNQPLDDIRVAIKTQNDTAVCYGMNSKPYNVTCDPAATNGAYRFFTIKNIPAYEIVVIEV